MDIVTITLNPALDLTTRLEVMHPGEVNLVSEANLRAAGKGINVAMVLKDLGRDVGLTGWLGEGNQQSFVSLFEERALADHFVRVAGDTRINVKISEQSGRVTDLNLPGLAVQEGDVSALEAALERLAPHTDWFVLAGSLPKGVAPDYCAPHSPAQGQGQAGDLRLQRCGVERRDQGGADPGQTQPGRAEPVGGSPREDPERAGRVRPRCRPAGSPTW